MNTRASDESLPHTRLKPRARRSAGGGSRWAQWVAPPGGIMRRRVIAFAETVVATMVAIGLCAVFAPHDPLLIQIQPKPVCISNGSCPSC
jgi:hypothetical protein